MLSRVLVKNSLYCEHCSCASADASLIAILRFVRDAVDAQILYLFCVSGFTVPPVLGGLIMRVFGITLDSRHFFKKMCRAQAFSLLVRFLMTSLVNFLYCVASSDVA